MNNRHLVLCLAFVALVGAGCAAKEAPKKSEPNPEPMQQENVRSRATVPPLPGILEESELAGKQIRVKTSKGDIVYEIFGKEAPLAASNMIWLVKHGFYNGLTFHRVEPGFVIQGGDPEGTGRGGPGYRFADEPVTREYDEGIVAMANAGPDTNGSQFFVMLADNETLPKNYTIFGKVTSGMDVVKAIRVGDVMTEVTIEDLQK